MFRRPRHGRDTTPDDRSLPCIASLPCSPGWSFDGPSRYRTGGVLLAAASALDHFVTERLRFRHPQSSPGRQPGSQRSQNLQQRIHPDARTCLPPHLEGTAPPTPSTIAKSSLPVCAASLGCIACSTPRRWKPPAAARRCMRFSSLCCSICRRAVRGGPERNLSGGHPDPHWSTCRADRSRFTESTFRARK